MALPELVRRTAEKKVAEFCKRRIPPHVRDEIRLEFGFRGNSVTIFECRPPWEGLPEQVVEWSRMKIVQLRYDPSTREWTLFWADRNGRWLRYWDLDPDPDLDRLIREIDDDPMCAFWG